MATKIRIYELAKIVEFENKQLLEVVKNDLGLEVKGSMSTLTRAEVDKVCATLNVSQEMRTRALDAFDAKPSGGKSSKSSKSAGASTKAAAPKTPVKRRGAVVMRRKQIIRILVERGADSTRAMDSAQRGLSGAFEDDPSLDREGYREVVELLEELGVG